MVSLQKETHGQMHRTGRFIPPLGEGSMMEDVQYFQMQFKKLQVLETPARMKEGCFICKRKYW